MQVTGRSVVGSGARGVLVEREAENGLRGDSAGRGPGVDWTAEEGERKTGEGRGGQQRREEGRRGER